MFTETKERFIRIALVPVVAARALALESVVNTPVVKAGGGPCLPPHSECPPSWRDWGVDYYPRDQWYKDPIFNKPPTSSNQYP